MHQTMFFSDVDAAIIFENARIAGGARATMSGVSAALVQMQEPDVQGRRAATRHTVGSGDTHGLGRSLELFNQQTRLAHQVLDSPAFRNGFAGVGPVFECVFVAAGGARPWSTTIHATTFFALDRR